jgi:hypothetical protein
MSDKFMGVQLGSHTVFDEGADQCLDTLQKTAGINAVFVYSHGDDRFAIMGRRRASLRIIRSSRRILRRES